MKGMTMSTPNNFHTLSQIEQGQANDALTDIAVALDDCNVHLRNIIPTISAREFDNRYQEVRAYLGAIRDAQQRLCELFYNTEVREPDPGVKPAWLYGTDCTDDCSCKGGK